MKRIAVVGGGMFGVASALELDEAGFNVHLFEKRSDILKGASGSNHWRLHRGYHYPQSDKTAESAYKTEPLFRKRFEDTVITERNHYYAVAKESWVSYEDYLSFLDFHGLEYEEKNLDLVNDKKVEGTLLVNENHVCPEKLRKVCWEQLEDSEVTLHLNTTISDILSLKSYDYKIIATYASSNTLLPNDHPLRRKYRFEVCEVPLITLPENHTNNNIIVVYGPFMSVDHWGSTEKFVMGDYHHMRHHTNVGYKPEIPEKYEQLINDGIVNAPDVTNFESFKNHGKQFIPGVSSANHVGSLFTIRTVLPEASETDARPTKIRQSDDVISIFGGKLVTSVQTAKDLVTKIQ